MESLYTTKPGGLVQTTKISITSVRGKREREGEEGD